MKIKFIILLFLILVISSQAQVITRESAIIQGEYFIGSDPGIGNGMPIQISNQQTNISVNLYNIALSTMTPIYVRFKNANGFWTNPRAISYPGFGLNRDAYINNLEYFIDTDPGEGKGNSVEISSEAKLDINLTSISFNKNQKLYLRVKDSEGRWSKPVVFGYPKRSIRLAEVIVGNNPTSIQVGEGYLMDPADGSFDSGFETISLTINNWNKQDTIWVRAQSSEYLWSIPIGTAFIAPTVATNSPALIGSTEVELEGTVNPNGLLTTAYFQWDTSAALQTSNYTPSQTINAGNGNYTVKEKLDYLTPGQTYYFKIVAESEGGKTEGEVLSFMTNPVSVESNEDIPKIFSLSQNYPNPFNPTTTINYSIPQMSFVTLKVYDMLGKEILTLVNEDKSVGNYEVKFNGSDFASGVYFYRLQTSTFNQTKKFILLR